MAKKKMRQPTAKELKKGRAGKTKFMRSPRYLTKGDKPGEMVYSKPNTSIYDEEVYNSLSNSMSNPANTAIPQQGTGRYVMSGPNKGTRRVTQVKSDVTGGRGKTNPPKVKGIKTVALKKNNSISKAMGEDYTKMPKKDMSPVIDSANRIAEMEAKAAAALKKKNKVKKKMGGGKVYERKHGGKVIKNNMSGQDLVNSCYDNQSFLYRKTDYSPR